MKILITGANGFVGKHCHALLKAQGYDVVAPTTKDLDISKPFTLKEHFDHVIHLAAYNITSVGDKNEDAYAKINVDGTTHVLNGVSCDHFIFLSTVKVYEGVKSAYAQSKSQAESMCQHHFKGKSLIILRSANILGPGQALKAIVPVFIEKAKANKPLELTVHSQTPIVYIDVRDIVELILAMIKHPSHVGIYNAAFPEPTTVHEMALKVIAATHSSSKITESVTSSFIPAVPIDCEKTWRDFAFKPRYSVDKILENMLS